MEEKERFELFGEHCIKDNNPDARCQLLDTYKACVILNEQYKENKQLKQQLAEKEKIEYTDTINFVETSEPDIVAKELDRLNEQLAEKDKEIEQLKKFDDLNKTFFNLFRTAFKEPDKVDDLFNTLKTIQEKHNQDKISFAVEQLEKVKEKILSYENVYYQFLESGAKVPVVCLENFRVKQTIDNQIKQLKEGVKNE